MSISTGEARVQESSGDRRTTAKPHRHSWAEDVTGLLTGTVLASFGLHLLHAAHLVTGGTAGLALLVSYAVPVPFGVVFVLVNAPFLLAAIRRKGWDFTLRTVVAILLVSGLSQLHALALPAAALTGPAGSGAAITPVYASVVGNLLAGVGLLIIFRHRASLGGFNIVALLVQERRGIPAGYVQMVLDLTVVLASVAVVSPANVAVSALGAAVLSIVIVFNHKPGRYTGW